jgi:hypothetical protein
MTESERRRRQGGTHFLFPFSAEAKIAVMMWRAMFYLISRHQLRYARSLQSFQSGPMRFGLETDASLQGAGGFHYEKTVTREVVRGGYAVNLGHLGFGTDSSYQNTSEFIGVILGLITLVKMGVRDVDLELRGDSISALSWSESERYSGENSTNAAMVFTLTCIAFGINVKNAIHKSGKQNWRADTLSRLGENGTSIEEAMISIGFGGVPVINLEGDPDAMALLGCCNPLRKIEGEEDFKRFWDEVRSSLVNLGADEPGPNEVRVE